MTPLSKAYIDGLIQTALAEDIPYLDVTTDLMLDDESTLDAYFLAKDTGVLCGMDIALRVFSLLDDRVRCTVLIQDGTPVHKGDILAELHGPAKALLKGERTALNLLQHMSGIASAAARCVKLADNPRVRICDTRKTLPGLRALQKYAVTVGGGKNHRINLSDGAMLKDNHIDAYGGITGAVQAFRQKAGHMVKLEVEVRSFDELDEAIAAGAEVIMLDNMSCEEMARAVKITAGRAILEASGNITEENICEVAQTGVDVISLGALTHSVKAFDISMKIK